MFILQHLHPVFLKTRLLVLVLISLQHSYAAELDSVRTRELDTLLVEAKNLRTTHAALPAQVYSQRELQALNALNVTDVAKYFSGVTVQDYGGIGGLKTVSVRGMGACFTGVNYDGVMMSDIQSGQVDLGRFSLENVSEISLSNGQPDDLFQSARVFASGSVFSVKTKFADKNTNATFKGNLHLLAGSFGMLNPSVFLATNAGKKWAFNLSADLLTADGTYSFLQYYGIKYNFSEILTRNNGDVKSARTEVNSRYNIRPNEQLTFKLNHYISERGLPGSVTFYNTDVSNQRLNDQVVFGQIHYENQRSAHWQHQYFARYNRAFNHYSDRNPKYQGGLLNETYLQQEFYAAAVVRYKPSRQFHFSTATDWWYNNLEIKSNIFFRDFAFPTRISGLTNVAGKYLSERITVAMNLLHTLTREQVSSGTAAPNRNKLSPTLSATFQPFEDKELRLRAFYKNIYRLPTFNDLYYHEIGNKNLRPENAHQLNLGATYSKTKLLILTNLELTVDAYYNHVSDKIIAVPRDLFHWSMTNKGVVEMKGVDVTLKINSLPVAQGEVRLMSNFSYLKATDRTPNSDNYGEQIPYTPQHSGVASLSFQRKWWELGYNLQYTGVRWIGQTTVRNNKMEAYSLHSIFANFTYKRIELKAELLNVFNTQYEVVKFYPMPRRNFRIRMGWGF